MSSANIFEDCSVNDNGDNLSSGFKELKVRKTLKDKEFRSYFEELEDCKNKNDSTIKMLRRENEKLREQYTQCLRGEKEIVDDVFRKRDRSEYLSMSNPKITSAIDLLDRKVFKQIRKIDTLCYNKRQKEATLDNLSTEIGDLRRPWSAQNETTMQLGIQSLANEADKMRMKLETAKRIGVFYLKLRDTLNDEVMRYPNRIAELERKIKENQSEIDDVHVTHEHAIRLETKSVNELKVLEHHACDAKRTRDQILLKSRREFDEMIKSKEQQDKKIGQSVQMKTLPSPFGVQLMDLKREFKARQLSRNLLIFDLKETADKLTNALTVSNIEDVLKTVKDQHMANNYLKREVKYRSSRMKKVVAELEAIDAELRKDKYSSAVKDTTAQQEIDFMIDLNQTMTDELEKETINFNATATLLQEVEAAAQSIFDKLWNVRLKPPRHNYSTGSTVLDLQICYDKLEQVMADISAIPDDSKVMAYCEANEPDRFMRFVDTRLPANFSVTLFDQDGVTTESFFECDDDCEGYRSNKDIKRSSLRLIEAHKIKQKKRISRVLSTVKMELHNRSVV